MKSGGKETKREGKKEPPPSSVTVHDHLSAKNISRHAFGVRADYLFVLKNVLEAVLVRRPCGNDANEMNDKIICC